MRKAIPVDKVFKPKPSQAELRVDATTRAARAIISEEVNARDAKTERLRAARLATEATEAPPIQKISAKKKTSRKR
ncbi:MAG: hypothetical protein L0I29_16505 [Hyphomicrobiales bacterium]|nr:hypothetical protein [Hyphomicrobiales bacterium]